MKYIFINPVIDQMYIREELNEVLIQNGYERVEIEIDWHKQVKEKYDKVQKASELTILDKRCPKAIETIEPYVDNQKALIPSIEPILIHCAIELAGRKNLENRIKIITTPCESLASYGNKLNLKDTEFISFNKLLKTLNMTKPLQAKVLDASPIPPGYFKSLDAKVSSISGEAELEEYFKKGLYEQDKIVEMLYCHNGCHSGDGVLINE